MSRKLPSKSNQAKYRPNLFSFDVFGKDVSIPDIDINQLGNKLGHGDTSEVLSNLYKPHLVANLTTGQFQKANFQTKQSLIVLRNLLDYDRITPEIKRDLLAGYYNQPFSRHAIVDYDEDGVPVTENRDYVVLYDEPGVLQGYQLIYKVTVTVHVWYSDFYGGTRTFTKTIQLSMNGSQDYLKDRRLLIVRPRVRDGKPVGKIYYDQQGFEIEQEEQEEDNYVIFDHGQQIENPEFSLLEQYVVSHIFSAYGSPDMVLLDHCDITNTFGETYDIETMKMRLSNNILNISVNLFNDIYDVVTSDDSCVLTFLRSYYKDLPVVRWALIYFNGKIPKDGINTKQLYDFAVTFDIKMIAYDCCKKVVKSYKPIKKDKSKQPLMFIAHSNHIYPLKNKVISQKVYDEDIPIVHCKSHEQLEAKFMKLINDNIVPAKPKLSLTNKESRIRINSFIHEGKQFIYNPNYEILKKIMTVFGIENKIKPDESIMTMMGKLEKKYNIIGDKDYHIDSFFPNLKDQSLAPIFYVNTNFRNVKVEDIHSYDKNKAYPYCLSKLPQILTCDIRTCNIVENPTEILDNYIYYIDTKQSSLLCENCCYIDGHHLKKLKQRGHEFTIKKGYECKLNENRFSQMIDDYYKQTSTIQGLSDDDKQFIKLVMNVYIGHFEQGFEVDQKHCISKICNFDEAQKTFGTYENCNKYLKDCENDKLYFSYDVKDFTKMSTRKIIAMQLKNMCRAVLVDKMDEMGVDESNLIRINTDSITFIQKDHQVPTNINKSYKGWKVQHLVNIGTEKAKLKQLFFADKKRATNLEDTQVGLYANLNVNKKNRNCLIEGYAGCGKSYYIVNKLIPQLNEKKMSYIILSPNHVTIEDYISNGYNAKVMKTSFYSKKIPEEDVVIIDEIGLCTKEDHDVIYNFFVHDKTIHAFGDFNQLPPVGESSPLNNKEYIHMIFKNRKFMTTNQRNKFTKVYYDKLINNEIDCVEEIKKYRSDDMFNVECIICRTNTTCGIYNDMVMEKLQIKLTDIGCKVQCRTNRLREYDIYNNYLLVVSKVDDEYIYFNKNIYKIPLKKYTKSNFKPAYARTLYNVQGKTLKSFYIPDSDLKYYEDGTNRNAYVAISRLFQSKQSQQ